MTAVACVWYLILESSAKMNVCVSYLSCKFRLSESSFNLWSFIYVCVCVYTKICIHPMWALCFPCGCGFPLPPHAASSFETEFTLLMKDSSSCCSLCLERSPLDRFYLAYFQRHLVCVMNNTLSC